MVDVVVTGVLAAPGVLKVLLGEERPVPEGLPVTLPGYALCLRAQGQHPALSLCDGATCAGFLIPSAETDLVDAISYYEECFGRTRTSVSVFDAEGMPREAETWASPLADGPTVDFEHWWQQWGKVATRMAYTVAGYLGRKPAAELQNSLYSMRIHAAAWCAAQERPADPEWDLAQDVVVHAHKRAYINFFSTEEMDLQFRCFDGTLSPVINRGAALIGAAAAVLPYDVGRDAVLLTEQFRAPVFIAGDRAPWLWEPPAGLIDPGETPHEAAMREAKEEAGLDVSHLEEVGSMYPSSGASSEFIHVFCGLADFSEIVGGGGVPSEGEDLRSKVISFYELMDGVDKRTFRDMPLVTAALWLARHRDRLRAEFG